MLCKPSMPRDSTYNQRNISNTLGKPSGSVGQAGEGSSKPSMGSRAVRWRATEGSDVTISHAGPALGSHPCCPAAPPALNHPSRTLSKTCSAASLGLLKVRFVTEKGGGSSDS